MDLDILLHHYFGTSDIDSLGDSDMARGREQLAIDFGVEREPSRRFALWTVMDALGFAPPPADAFEDPRLREAADAYLTAAWRIERRSAE